jgi:hypothetical protein
MDPFPLGGAGRLVAGPVVPLVIDAVKRILAYEPCASLAFDLDDWSEG